MDNEQKELEILEDKSFYEHLKELRLRLLYSIIFFIIAFTASFYNSEKIIEYLIKNTNNFRINNNSKISFCVINITDLLYSSLKTAAYVGFIISLPFILWQCWLFIKPALKSREEQIIKRIMILSFLLFLGGNVILLYFGLHLISTFLLKTFYKSYLTYTLSINSYVDFVIVLSIVFGVIFQTPIIIIALIKSKVVDIERFLKLRKYIITLAFIIGGILTPPDVFSQIIVSIIIILLVELGIIIAKFFL